MPGIFDSLEWHKKEVWRIRICARANENFTPWNNFFYSKLSQLKFSGSISNQIRSFKLNQRGQYYSKTQSFSRSRLESRLFNQGNLLCWMNVLIINNEDDRWVCWNIFFQSKKKLDLFLEFQEIKKFFLKLPLQKKFHNF
jgi:hypothetical protein